jgi:acetyl-CoA acetyltransferase
LPHGTRGHRRGASDAVGKFLGSFAETPAVELGELAAKEALRRANVEADEVDQAIIGHARQAGNGPNTGRQVSIRAGSKKAPQRQLACGSGMKRPAGAQRAGARSSWWGKDMTCATCPDMRLGSGRSGRR